MSDTLSRVMVQVYSKLAATFGTTNTVARPSDSVLSIMIPGLLIDTKLDPNDPQTQYRVANALDPTLACSWAVQPQGATVSNVYRSILDGKEAPLIDLPPEQRRRVDEALAFLFVDGSRPSAEYRAYLECQSAYLTALDAFEEAQATADNGGPPVPQAVRDALLRAEDAWTIGGYRHEVGAALETLRLHESYEPSVYWARLTRQFTAWTRSYGLESQYQFVDSIPPFKRWFSDDGWTTFRFEPDETRKQLRSGMAGIGDNSPTAWPDGQGIGLRVDGATEPEGPDPVVDDVRLYCELRRIEIVRPWLDVNVFSSRAWRWSPASVAHGSVVSSGGDIAGGIVPDGRMPVLPLSAVLSRNLVLTWRERIAGGLHERLCAARDAGRRISIGPFDLTGAALAQGRIEMPFPQLIGFRSLVLPRCPDPDPDLPWPTPPARFWSAFRGSPLAAQPHHPEEKAP